MKFQNWKWLKTHREGQFFERKSCYDRSGRQPKRRDARSVARDVAETLAAMANADGGTLVLGMEDDGRPTGLDYPKDGLEVILRATERNIRPLIKTHHQWANVDNIKVLVFEVDWSQEVHQLTDGRYLLRVGDQNLPFPASDIAAMKEGKRRRVTEAQFIGEASLNELDKDLFDQLRKKTGLALSDAEILQHYRLAEPRNGRVVLSLAAMLLFAKDPLRWHPACHIDFVKWEGTERRFGAELNVVKRVRIEAPLLRLIEQTFQTIWPHIRERQRLVDLFFEERFEYPVFAWQEAVINAVAHRDYALEGTPIEVWIFDDRLELRSPGALVEPVTIERLERRERIHASRNPRVVRVLTDMGYMRELGEGVPRMFEVMEREGLKPPEFHVEGGAIFTVILHNTPVYSPDTLRWLKQFGEGLNPNQKRLLAYAHGHAGRFTSRAYQKLVGVGIYAASKDIKDLIHRGLVQLERRGGRVYQLIDPEKISGWPKAPREFLQIEPLLREKGYVKNEDVRQVLGVSRAQATRFLQDWAATGFLTLLGKGRGAQYVQKENASL
ncbi:MAG: putative DNA binding domain-containing protein [Desulfobacterales bacterium]|nr:putative DNA binding domain-containing protein [Desulfobacterales bacterium]